MGYWLLCLVGCLSPISVEFVWCCLTAYFCVMCQRAHRYCLEWSRLYIAKGIVKITVLGRVIPLSGACMHSIIRGWLLNITGWQPRRLSNYTHTKIGQWRNLLES